jgi:arginase
VPRAWGAGGEQLVEAARLELPYPEAAVVDEETLAMQTLAIASELPERPVVLGGCCCAHVGAVEGLAARRRGRLGVVWIDAHGDLNTPETSPSGNEWGMALRMLLDAGTVAPGDVALVGARELDPGERAFIASSGLQVGPDAVPQALDGADAVYVAIDADGLAPSELVAFLPVPGGLGLDEAERLLADVRGRVEVAGAGWSGLAPDPRNVEPVVRLCAALGL